MKDRTTIVAALDVIKVFMTSAQFERMSIAEKNRIMGYVQALCWSADHCEESYRLDSVLDEMTRSVDFFGSLAVPPAWMRQ